MMCAREMNGFKQVADFYNEIERAKEIAKEQEREERRKELSIAYCETEILELLKSAAKRGHRIIDITLGKVRRDSTWKNDYYSLIKKEKKHYANGKSSYCIDTNCFGFNLDTIISYLREHCYSVKVVETCYNEYGRGRQPAVMLIISY